MMLEFLPDACIMNDAASEPKPSIEKIGMEAWLFVLQ